MINANAFWTLRRKFTNERPFEFKFIRMESGGRLLLKDWKRLKGTERDWKDWKSEIIDSLHENMSNGLKKMALNIFSAFQSLWIFFNLFQSSSVLSSQAKLIYFNAFIFGVLKKIERDWKGLKKTERDWKSFSVVVCPPLFTLRNMNIHLVV